MRLTVKIIFKGAFYMSRFFGLSISLALLLTLSCAGGGTPQQDDNLPPSQDAQPQQAPQNWTGNGGKGMSLAILAPRATGLAENQGYLPALVQGEFVSNFSGYSAISVMDRENLQKVYDELLSEYYSENDAAGLDLGHLTATDYLMTGNITKTATGYALQIQVTKTADKMAAASYSGTFTFADLDNLTGIRRASTDLLQKMGVTLTAKAREELSGAAVENHVNAQTALAKGITAQRQGTEVAALSYYFQAATFDPSLMEAANRSSILNANISSGNIGDNVRNDIQWRRDWVARLTETEQYFDSLNRAESMPYTLFYLSDEIKQGTVNYQNETVSLSVETHLHGSGIWTLSIERALQAVYDGLDATKRKDTWGLASWPRQGVTNLNAFARRSGNFTVVFELLNNQNKAIGRQTLQAGGSWGLSSSGRPAITVNADERKTLVFQNVNANDITDRMTIRVATVNGADAEIAARNGVLQIRAITRSDFDRNSSNFRFARGEIQGFVNNAAKTENLVIPGTIWGDPVVAIGREAFRNAGLTRVTIPNSVISIGNSAFANNKLTNITIPNSVTSIGNSAFADNKLTNITIPNSVTSIGDSAFFRNQLTSTAIPNNVISIGNSAFADNKLTGVTIGNSVTSIGNSAFSPNLLTSITIPNSVTSIGEGAFHQHHAKNGHNRERIASVTIGANVIIAKDAFRYHDDKDSHSVDDKFENYYTENNKKAGTYTRTVHPISALSVLVAGTLSYEWRYSP
jgi:hypothetical protein